jgi:hypothetical protein
MLWRGGSQQSHRGLEDRTPWSSRRTRGHPDRRPRTVSAFHRATLTATVRVNATELASPTPSRGRWVLRIGSTRACSMTRVTRRPLVVRGLHDARDWPLVRIHVIQPVIGADRVRMGRCAGANARTRTRHVRRPRPASHLSSESGAGASTHEGRYKNRSRHC